MSVYSPSVRGSTMSMATGQRRGSGNPAFQNLYSGTPGKFVWDPKKNTWVRETTAAAAGQPQAAVPAAVTAPTDSFRANVLAMTPQQVQAYVKARDPNHPSVRQIQAMMPELQAKWAAGGSSGATTPAGGNDAVMPPAAGAPTTTPAASPAVSSGGQMYQQLIADFKAKMDASNAANESRYGEIKGGYDAMQANVDQALAGLGTQARADIDTRYKQLGATQQQNLVSRGLAGTSVPFRAASGLETQKSGDINRLNEQIAQTKLGYQTDIAGNKLNFMERRNDTGPNMGQYLELLRGYADSGALGNGGAPISAPVAAPGTIPTAINGGAGHLLSVGTAYNPIKALPVPGGAPAVQPMTTQPAVYDPYTTSFRGTRYSTLGSRFRTIPTNPDSYPSAYRRY